MAPVNIVRLRSTEPATQAIIAIIECDFAHKTRATQIGK